MNVWGTKRESLLLTSPSRVLFAQTHTGAKARFSVAARRSASIDTGNWQLHLQNFAFMWIILPATQAIVDDFVSLDKQQKFLSAEKYHVLVTFVPSPRCESRREILCLVYQCLTCPGCPGHRPFKRTRCWHRGLDTSSLTGIVQVTSVGNTWAVVSLMSSYRHRQEAIDVCSPGSMLSSPIFSV